MTGSPDLIVVTGAAGGMGQALVRRLIADGHEVLGIDHNADRLAGLGRDMGPSLRPLVSDLEEAGLAERVLDGVRDRVAVAGLVNLAGASIGAPLDHLSDADWDRSFAVNVTPAMRLTRVLAPLMVAQGRGSIVNVGSPVGIVGARKPSYAASKAALHGLTMASARSLGASGVRVNLLLPGPTITYMTDDWSQDRRRSVADESFLRRLCRPEEVAAVIAFLLSEESSYVTGAVLDMTAGSMFGH